MRPVLRLAFAPVSAPAVASRLLRPLRPRDPGERGRVASELELLTDLCFVVAVGQAALALHHGLTSGHAGPAACGLARMACARRRPTSARVAILTAEGACPPSR